jgi:hypothetical protein
MLWPKTSNLLPQLAGTSPPIRKASFRAGSTHGICYIAKRFEFTHAFSLYAADPYAGCLIARLAFEARYSGARHYISDRDHGCAIRNMAASFGRITGRILSFGAAYPWRA